MLITSYFIVGCGAFTGMLLLASGAVKMLQLAQFEEAVRGFELLPGRLVLALARALPVIETLIGFALLLGVGFESKLLGSAAAGAMMLFLTFGVAVAINLLRGRRKIACGCFGRDSDSGISWSLVLRNGFFFGVAAIGSGLFSGMPGRLGLSGFRRLDAILVTLAILLSWHLLDHAFKLSRYTRLLADAGWKV
jgi:hypothetical protein